MGLCFSTSVDKPKSPLLYAVPSNRQTTGKILAKPDLKTFSFNELKEATNNFSPRNVLGKGAFGCVFKGWIYVHSFMAATPETGMSIAVKMLNQKSCQGQQEWLAEIKYLGQLQHPNLVKLIGYCLEEDQRLLVYEFVPNGSLDRHLFIQQLSWNRRMKVAIGAAKGLAFLHDDAQVIYRDFKSSNILLDSNYNAKLSDFGLAKDGPIGDKSHLTASILGTQGYMAPEYMLTGHLTLKVDVYGFGVVLLELISGKPAFDEFRPSNEQNLVSWAMPDLTNKRKIFQVFGAFLEGKNELSGALKAANLAVQCLSSEPSARPSMKEVIKALEQIVLDKH